ncbi:MAG: hypothetical protein IT582_00630 [Opitutaceae bacterium]|nr:hypothetical protein [Opitutaceae bacterium]
MTTHGAHTPVAWRGDLLAAGLTLLWLFIVRAALACPWGFASVTAPDGLLQAIPFNPDDTWSYLSWIVQYRDGQFGADLLYTTEPHPALLWVFPLWLIGVIAKVLSIPTLGAYWLVGLLGAGATVMLFRCAARALGLEPSAVDWTTVILVLGSGASWLWHGANRIGFAPPMAGGEFLYLDLFSSTAFTVYPYHTVSFALLAGLWWAVAVSEQRLSNREPARLAMGWTTILALLLGFSRPYEPLAFAAAYALKSGWLWWKRSDNQTDFRACLIVMCVLAVGLLPGVVWNAYVSIQPVWSTFAQRSLALGLDRISWLSAFGGLWLLALMGFLSRRRVALKPCLLPLTATLLAIVVLIGIPHAQAKLASGLILGTALLGGWGASAIVRWSRSLRGSTLAFACAALSLTGLLGTPSMAMGLLAIRLASATTIDPALNGIVDAIPAVTRGHRTVVLTDSLTGGVLPGWRGLRVYAGHFSLTHDFERKRDELAAAGFDLKAQTSSPQTITPLLTSIVKRAAPDYALVKTDYKTVGTALRHLGWQPVSRNSGWQLFRAPEATK